MMTNHLFINHGDIVIVNVENQKKKILCSTSLGSHCEHFHL